MSREESVDTGEVKACRGEALLRASAIGSCVVVTAHDPESGVGAMAHVMLPGSSRQQHPSKKTRYAADAVEEMIQKMFVLGARKARICSFLVGGANVLGEGHETPGPEIVRSVTDILKRQSVGICARHIGGMERRSCMLDVGYGRVTYTVGDSEPRVLWEVAEDEANCGQKTFTCTYLEGEEGVRI